MQSCHSGESNRVGQGRRYHLPQKLVLRWVCRLPPTTRPIIFRDNGVGCGAGGSVGGSAGGSGGGVCLLLWLV